MGYLTPVLIYNDDAHVLLEDSDIGKKLYKATQLWVDSDIALYSSKKPSWWKFWKKPKIESGYLKALATEHNSVTRIIVVHGNTWIDLTEPQRENNYDYFKECLKLAESEIKIIKARINPSKPKKNKKVKK